MTNWKIGDKVFYVYVEFDGSGIVEGIVTEVQEDHLIMTDKDGINYWLEDGFNEFFSTKEQAETYYTKKRKEGYCG